MPFADATRPDMIVMYSLWRLQHLGSGKDNPGLLFQGIVLSALETGIRMLLLTPAAGVQLELNSTHSLAHQLNSTVRMEADLNIQSRSTTTRLVA